MSGQVQFVNNWHQVWKLRDIYFWMNTMHFVWINLPVILTAAACNIMRSFWPSKQHVLVGRMCLGKSQCWYHLKYVHYISHIVTHNQIQYASRDLNLNTTQQCQYSEFQRHPDVNTHWVDTIGMSQSPSNACPACVCKHAHAYSRNTSCPPHSDPVCETNSGSTIREHYSDVKMGELASQINNLTIVYSTVYSGAD